MGTEKVIPAHLCKGVFQLDSWQTAGYYARVCTDSRETAWVVPKLFLGFRHHAW